MSNQRNVKVLNFNQPTIIRKMIPFYYFFFPFNNSVRVVCILIPPMRSLEISVNLANAGKCFIALCTMAGTVDSGCFSISGLFVVVVVGGVVIVENSY